MSINPNSLTLSVDAIKQLNSINCCCRCILRFSNIVNQQIYLY